MEVWVQYYSEEYSRRISIPDDALDTISLLSAIDGLGGILTDGEKEKRMNRMAFH